MIYRVLRILTICADGSRQKENVSNHFWHYPDKKFRIQILFWMDPDKKNRNRAIFSWIHAIEPDLNHTKKDPNRTFVSWIQTNWNGFGPYCILLFWSLILRLLFWSLILRLLFWSRMIYCILADLFIADFMLSLLRKTWITTMQVT